MPKRDGAAGEIAAAGEAMQHRGVGPLPHLLFEDARGVVVGLARMDDQRQSGLARRRDMRAEAALLRLARRIVVVVVEPGFAERDDLGVTRAENEIGGGQIELFVRIMRMRADRAKNVGKALGDRQHSVMTANARRDGHDAPDTDVARASDHGVELGGEIGKVEMAVAIDEHVSIVPRVLRLRHNAGIPAPAPAA